MVGTGRYAARVAAAWLAAAGCLTSAAAQDVADDLILVLGGPPQGTPPTLPDLDKVTFATGSREAFDEGREMTLVLRLDADDPALRGLAPWLDGLARRGAAHGLKVAVVSAQRPVPADLGSPPWFLLTGEAGPAVDPTTVSLSIRNGPHHAYPIDAGLGGWIEAHAAGTADVSGLTTGRVENLGQIEDQPTEALRAAGDHLVEANKGCPDGWILKLIVAVERDADLAEAGRIVAEAGRHMVLDAPAMARFVEQALMTWTHDDGLLRSLQMAITPAAFAHREWLPIQTTYLRVLNQLGQKVPLRKALEDVRGPEAVSPAEALRVAEVLAFGKCAREFEAEAQAYLEKARELGWEYSWVRYNVVRFCVGDEEVAAELARSLCPQPSNLNNQIWYAITEHPKRGRFNELAFAWAKRMVETTPCDPNEYDTAALAYHLHGDLAKAVEYQEIAVGNGAAAPYQRRLARFRKIAEAAGVEIK